MRLTRLSTVVISMVEIEARTRLEVSRCADSLPLSESAKRKRARNLNYNPHTKKNASVVPSPVDAPSRRGGDPQRSDCGGGGALPPPPGRDSSLPLRPLPLCPLTPHNPPGRQVKREA